jgi:hypothetical protein
MNANYSMENAPDLEIDDTSLTTEFSEQNYIGIETDNNEYVNLSGTATYFKYLFKEPNQEMVAEAFTITAKVKSLVAPSTKNVYLQIYNRTTEEWEMLDTESSANAGVEFTLLGSVREGYEDYFDSNYIISCRVYQ